jgi:hypothetical protein
VRACVSFCCALCVNDGNVHRNTNKVKVKANASVFVFMLWCEKRGNNGVFYVLVDLKVKSEESSV